MENASKALVIAGEILLAIILLTLFSYLFTLMAENTSRIEEKAKLKRINEFNQEFLNYEGRGINKVGEDSSGKPIYNPLTTQDVATLINLAIDNDKKYKFYTKVRIDLNGNDLTTDNHDGNEWLSKKMNDNKIDDKYKCISVQIDESSKLVKTVILINN